MSRFILAFVIPLVLFAGCNKKNEPCEGVSCKDTGGGLIPLGEKAMQMIAYSKGDTLSFINSKGFVAPYTVAEFDTTHTEEVLFSDDSTICCPYRNKVYGGRRYYVKLTSDLLPLQIVLTAEKNKPLRSTLYNYPLESIRDIVSVEMNKPDMYNGFAWRLPLSTDISYIGLPNRIEYRDTITLNNKLYHEVYHLFYASTDKSLLQPVGVYINHTDKLIGFYYNNGEHWFRR